MSSTVEAESSFCPCVLIVMPGDHSAINSVWGPFLDKVAAHSAWEALLEIGVCGISEVHELRAGVPMKTSLSV